MIGSWAVNDGSGNELANGLEEHRAQAVAQSIADRLGQTVYLYQEGDDEMMTITPSDRVQSDDPEDDAACVAEMRAEHEADVQRMAGDEFPTDDDYAARYEPQGTRDKPLGGDE